MVLTFLCGCSLIWEKVVARCLSLSAFFKNGLGRFSSSCRSHCTGEDGVTSTWEDFVLVKVPVDEADVFDDEAVGCSELERWCTAGPALVVLVMPIFVGGVGIRDVRRVRVLEVRVEVVLDADEEMPVVFTVTELDPVSFVADDVGVLRSGFDGVGGGFGVSDGASDVSPSCIGSSAFGVFSSSWDSSKIFSKLSPTFGVATNKFANWAGAGVLSVSPVDVKTTPFMAEPNGRSLSNGVLPTFRVSGVLKPAMGRVSMLTGGLDGGSSGDSAANRDSGARTFLTSSRYVFSFLPP